MQNKDIKGLISKVINQESQPVIQKITEVKTPSNKEVQFSFYIEKALLTKLKLKSIEDGTSIKSIINKSIEIYLNSKR